MATTQCVCTDCNIAVQVDLNFRGGGVEFVGCNTTVKCPKCGENLTIPDGKYASNLYGNYLSELSLAYESSLSKIRTHHNFEHGDEFEIAICETLRLILPAKYGICRGFVVDSAGNRAGDDILVYDRVRFPTIRLEEKERLDRLQQIPIEAVYIYIEAKNTLHLSGEDSQSLKKSVKQVARVKKLIDKRVKIPSNGQDKNLPSIRNPMLGVMVANNVRDKKGGQRLEDSQVIEGLVGNKIISDGKFGPDIILTGKNVLALPFFRNKTGSFSMTLPYSQSGTSLIPNIAQDVAFGTMISAIFLAMDWVVLGPMPWQSIVSDGFGIKSE